MIAVERFVASKTSKRSHVRNRRSRPAGCVRKEGIDFEDVAQHPNRVRHLRSRKQISTYYPQVKTCGYAHVTSSRSRHRRLHKYYFIAFFQGFLPTYSTIQLRFSPISTPFSPASANFWELRRRWLDAIFRLRTIANQFSCKFRFLVLSLQS